MPKKKIIKTDTEKPAEVHKDLKGFDIRIDTFGQMETNMSISKLNDFLNEKGSDKKITSEEE